MNVALIFAGGIGSRMWSEIPKQFLEWNGKAIIIHTLKQFENHPEIDEIVIACKEDWIDYTRELVQKEGLTKITSIVPGGATALDSQYYGLKEILRLHFPDYCEDYDDAVRKKANEITVLIHDGVRPLIDAATISGNIEAVQTYGNAITVTNAIETVIRIDKDEAVREILDRDYCRMAKAPQSFRLGDILEIHERAINEGKHDFIDSASMMIYYGHTLHTVIGDPENIKITTPSDYYMFTGISTNRENKGQED